MEIGIDLVKISRLEKLLENRAALEKIFLPKEICDNPQRLAGYLAVKEAYFKACGKKGDWLDLTIEKNPDGQPQLLVKGEIESNIKLSLSHDGDYAVAVVIIE